MAEDKPIFLDPRVVAQSISQTLYNTIKTNVANDLNTPPDATEKAKGIIQIANQAEVLAGTVDNKAVVPKYLPNRYRLATDADIIIYVSANGDDATADGSESKPFRTVINAHRYIRRNIILANESKFVAIKFLTDYTETKSIIRFYPTLGQGKASANNLIYIDGQGHNVTLHGIQAYSTCISFNNVNFVFDDNYYDSGNEIGCQSRYGGQIYLDNNNTITINFTKATDRFSLFYSVSGQIALNSPLPIIINAISLYALLFLEQHSVFTVNVSAKPLFKISGKCKFINAAFISSSLSFLNLRYTIENTGTFTGKKYYANMLGLISNGGRGDTIPIGDTPGTVENGGVYY